MLITITHSSSNLKKLIKEINSTFNVDCKPRGGNQIIFDTLKPIYASDSKAIKLITNKLTSIPSITYVLSPDINTSDQSMKNKNFHIFFDIDSTLTHLGVKSLSSIVKGLFKQFQAANCTIYFCTGRSYQDVIRLNNQYSLSDYGIAEGGGVIVGLAEYRHKLGDITEPDKLLEYMNKNNIDYRIDPSQSPRLTEHVLLKKSITKSLKTIIDQSGCRVSYHSGKKTYHISAKNIDKGKAIDYLIGAEELDLNRDLNCTIGVGDSDLDIPMFEICDYSCSVGNNNKVKTAATYNLKQQAPYALQELYTHLFPYT